MASGLFQQERREQIIALLAQNGRVSVADLGERGERVMAGKSRIINLTDYKQGYTIISLERYRRGSGKSYATLNQVLATLEEGIMDRILKARQIPFTRFTPKSRKKSRLVALLCADLQMDPRAMRPEPIYIDWKNGCKFTPDIPRDRLNNYRIAGETAFVKGADIYAKFPNPKAGKKTPADNGGPAILVGTNGP